MTTDDVAEVALEEAGLAHTPRPQVGDGRPTAEHRRPRAPDRRLPPRTRGRRRQRRNAGTTKTARRRERQANGANGDGTAAPKRRRRRGGRGRGRSGTGAAGGGTGGGTTPEVAARRQQRQPKAAPSGGARRPRRRRRARGRARRRHARAPPRPHPQGPPGRSLPDVVHVLDDGHTHIAVLEGRSLVEHYVATPDDDDDVDRRQHLPRPGAERAARAWRPRSSTSARRRTACCTAATSRSTRPTSRAASKPTHRARAASNGQSIIVQVTKNPIGAQGRAPHPGGEPRRPLRRDGAGPARRPTASRSACPTTSASACAGCSTACARTTPASSCAPRPRARPQEELERDMRRLSDAVGADLRARQEGEAGAACSTRSRRSSLRLIREEFTKEYRGVVIDDRALYEEVRGYVEAIAPELADRVEYYDAEAEGLPIFERFHVHEQLHKALDRKVWLPSGGSLDHRAHRGAHRHRRQHRQERRQVEPRGDGLPQQPRGGRGGRPAAPAARHRRDHRHRLHRHGDQGEPRRGRCGRSARRWPATRPAPRCSTISELGLVEMTRKRVSEGLVEAFSRDLPDLQRPGLRPRRGLL